MTSNYLGFLPSNVRNPEGTGVLGDWGNHDMFFLPGSAISAEFGQDANSVIQAERAFLDEQAKWRLEPDIGSGHHKPQLFYPQQLVFYWGKQTPKSETSHPSFKKEKYLGPAMVLATETKVDSQRISRPATVIWHYRGNSFD